MSSSIHSPDYRLLLDVLRNARKQQAVSQAELAARLDNTQTFVSKSERGERRIDFIEFVEFAEALEIQPEALLRDYLNRRSERKAGSRKSARSKKSPGLRKQMR